MKNPAWLAEAVLKARKSGAIAWCKPLLPARLRQWAWGLVRSRPVLDVMGSKVFVPEPARNPQLVLDHYEPQVAAQFREILKEGMTFCDVGANIGVFTLLGAKLVGPTGHVVAFEPIPDNAEVLRGNVARNSYANVTVLQKAVSDTPGVARIHLSTFCGSHSLVSNPDAATGQILEVETVRLDGVAGLERIDLLKIDAEGAEPQVLRSLGARRPAHLILEYNGARLRAAGMPGPAFLKFLHDLGFKDIYNLDDPPLGLKPLEQADDCTVNLYMTGA